jgi:tetratricopeptide (TPR) repeat protein
MGKTFLPLFILIFSASVAFGQSAEELYKQAGELYDKAEFARAIQIIDKAIMLDSTTSKYYLLKADALEKEDNLKEAYFTYSLAIAKFPKESYAYNQRGLLLLRIREYEHALNDYNTALEFEKLDTLQSMLFLNRGTVKRRVRDFEGAYDDFMAVLRIDSLHIGALNNIAAVCDEVGRGDETIPYLKKVLAIDSTFIGGYANIGYKYQEMGDHKTAIEYYDKVLSMDPEEPLGYSNRAFNRYKLGELPGALSDINRSIELYPANSYAYRVRALIYLAQKEKAKACADLEEALRQGFTKTYGDEVEKLKAENCAERLNKL